MRDQITEEKIIHELEKARQEIESLRRENAELRKMLGMAISDPKADYREHELLASIAPLPRVDSNSSTQEKIELFRTLFRGREDVYAVFWFNERTGKKGYSPAMTGFYPIKTFSPKAASAISSPCRYRKNVESWETRSF